MLCSNNEQKNIGRITIARLLTTKQPSMSEKQSCLISSLRSTPNKKRYLKSFSLYIRLCVRGSLLHLQDILRPSKILTVFEMHPRGRTRNTILPIVQQVFSELEIDPSCIKFVWHTFEYKALFLQWKIGCFLC